MMRVRVLCCWSLVLSFALSGCNRYQAKAFLIAMNRSLKKQQQQRQKDSSQRTAQKSRQPSMPSSSPQVCRQNILRNVALKLRGKGVSGVVVTSHMSRKRETTGRLLLAVKLLDKRPHTTRRVVYKEAYLTGSCRGGWVVERFYASPVRRRVVPIKRAPSKDYQVAMRARALNARASIRWSLRLEEASVSPFKANGHCWDLYCTPQDKNRFRHFLRKKVDEYAKKKVETYAKTQLISALGLTTIQATIVISVASFVISRKTKPEVFGRLHLSHKQYYSEKRGGQVRLKHRLVNQQFVGKTRYKKDRFATRWGETFSFGAREGAVMKVELWDRDLVDDDRIGHFFIPIHSKLATGQKICIKGHGRVVGLCFRLSKR